MVNDPIGWYEQHGDTVFARYEALRFEQVHGWLMPYLPANGGVVLDIGAGSGRDAAWLADQSYDVIAVEPSRRMREAAKSRHPSPRIRWFSDALPDLQSVHRSGLSFDLILLSAVWMHVPPGARRRALRKCLDLLKPGGKLALTLRHGEALVERGIYSVSVGEVERICRELGAFVVHRCGSEDHLGRDDVTWSQVVVSIPDDRTGALPTLRHVILNDAKASTYKLALLRVLCRVADSSHGVVEDSADDHVSVPLGLVGLFWLRAYKPLLDQDLPQQPSNRGTLGLGFVKAAYGELAGISPLDLRPGMRFTGNRAKALHAAVRDAVRTIVTMPAHYTTGTDGCPLLKTVRRKSNPHAALVLNRDYFRSFGEMQVPRHLWQALARYDAWIEPAIVSEWVRLMDTYAQNQGRKLGESRLRKALIWSDPLRDVRDARDQARALMARGQRLRCVWSEKPLSENLLDMDHCFPWRAWPCDGLWNLLPAHPRVNQTDKRARLPSVERLESAKSAIIDWWRAGYWESPNPAFRERFLTEALTALPAVDSSDLESVFEGVMTQRLRLHEDQQIPEW